MRYKLLISFLLCSFAFVVTQAREDRHICQKAFEVIENKAEVFKIGADWFPYPAYSDREGWNTLLGENKDYIIKNGKKLLLVKDQLL